MNIITKPLPDNKSKLIDDFIKVPIAKKEEKGIEIIKSLLLFISTQEIEISKYRSLVKVPSWKEVKSEFLHKKDLFEKLLVIEDFIESHRVFLEVKDGVLRNPYLFLPFMYTNYRNKDKSKDNRLLSGIQSLIEQQNKKEQEQITNVFHKLSLINEDINDLDYTNYEDAKKVLQGLYLKNYEITYKRKSRELIGILNDVFNIYTRLIAKREREEIMFNRYISMYGEAIRAKLSQAVDTNTGVGFGLEKYFNYLNAEADLTPEGMLNQMRLDELRKKKNIHHD